VIVAGAGLSLGQLEGCPNVGVLRFKLTGVPELDRLILGLRHLGRITRREGGDLLWAINIGPYMRIGTPYVLSVHNAHQVYPWRFSRYHPGNRWRVAALRWFFRRSLRLADGVVVQTPVMADLVRQIRGVPRRIFVAPKAVESERDVNALPLPPAVEGALRAGLGKNTFTWLYVATWAPHKNHRTLINAFARLARQGIRTRVVFTVTAGDLLAAGWAETATLYSEGRVLPVGWVSKENLRSLYTACDACLMPSVLESLSSAHLEAMRWERPQIVADLPYSRDVCGPAALYAGAEDATDWANKICWLMDHPEEGKQLTAAGLERMKRFPVAWDEAATNLRRFFDTILRQEER
jgi:glycosyltransferase involved in cell wall biosynthesis